VLALAVVPSVVACGGEEGDSSMSQTARRDSAGVTVLTHPGPGDAPRLTAVERLRLGTLDEDGPQQFSQVLDVALGPEGRVYVANDATVSVRVFAADGSFEAEFGGRGEGPGEMRMVNDLIVTGDTAVVIDWQGGGKVTLFRRDGTLVDEWRVRRPEGPGIFPMHPVRGGWLATVGRSAIPSDLEPGESWTSVQDIHLVDFGANSVGEKVHEMVGYTLYGVPGGEGGVDWGLFREVPGLGYDARGRMVRTHGPDYRIDVTEPGGTTTLSVRRPIPPEEITPAHVDALRARVGQVMDTIAVGDESWRPRQRRVTLDRLDRQAAMPVPEAASPLGELLVGRDGSFWVRIFAPGTLVEREVEQMFGRIYRGTPSEPTTWDVYESDGSFVGSVELPARFRPDDVRGRRVAGVAFDDLDVEYVVVYEAVASPGG
jgi:hypothetical protein